MRASRIVFGAVILAVAFAGVIVAKRYAAQKPAEFVKKEGNPQAPGTTRVPVPQETSPPARAEDPPVAESLANQPSVRSEKAPGAASATPNKKAGGAPKDPLTDPLARVALSLVGADLDAEIYWAAAINDPGHPPGERQDLIEDLNEEGFSDPKHPTPDDLPLIMSRIALIEEFWPSAMDKTNWEAFDEAYKDLWNLYDLALGDGQPVK